MNKVECLSKASAARHAAKVASQRAALYAATFGGSDELTQKALMDVDVANEVASSWDRISTWHPATRNSAIRNGKIPAFMFNPY